MAAVFLLLAAVWLYPSAVEGQAVMGEIAGIFTRSVGPSLMGLFIFGAFAATFSTAFNYFDGLAEDRGRVLPQPVPRDGGADGNRSRRPDRREAEDLVLGVQHLPSDDGLLADWLGARDRGAPETGFPGAGGLRPRVLHRAR